MSKVKVVVTDYTFPDLERERWAAVSAGAVFESHQCKSANEVMEAVRGANIVVAQFAPVTEAAIAGLAENAAGC